MLIRAATEPKGHRQVTCAVRQSLFRAPSRALDPMAEHLVTDAAPLCDRIPERRCRVPSHDLVAAQEEGPPLADLRSPIADNPLGHVPFSPLQELPDVFAGDLSAGNLDRSVRSLHLPDAAFCCWRAWEGPTGRDRTSNAAQSPPESSHPPLRFLDKPIEFVHGHCPHLRVSDNYPPGTIGSFF